MSHELRTPLNAIIGFSDIVRTRAFGDSEKYSEYGGFIHQSGHHLLNLISDILDLAKIEAGKKVLNHAPVDLKNIIIDAAQSAGDAVREKGVTLEQSVPPSLPLLSADPQAVRQILDNLLSNAVRFTPAGGRIEIAAFQVETGEVALAVSDTGIGIAPEDQAHIFTRLGHRRPEVTTAERGSGLGLPIVKGLVDMLGGRIELHSVPGEGTCVAVFFPVERLLKETDTRAA
jgi:two-component system cell cycle sensor histidine kinase PleC